MRSKWTSSYTTNYRKDPFNVSHSRPKAGNIVAAGILPPSPWRSSSEPSPGRRPATRTVAIADAGRHADTRRHAFVTPVSPATPAPTRRAAPASSSSIPSMTTTPVSPSTIRPDSLRFVLPGHAGDGMSTRWNTAIVDQVDPNSDPRHVGRLPRRGAARPHDHRRWRRPGPGVRPEGPIREHRRPWRRPSPCPDLRQRGQCRRRRGRVPVTGALLLTRMGVRARKTQPETGGSSLAWNPAPRRVVR